MKSLFQKSLVSTRTFRAWSFQAWASISTGIKWVSSFSVSISDNSSWSSSASLTVWITVAATWKSNIKRLYSQGWRHTFRADCPELIALVFAHFLTFSKISISSSCNRSDLSKTDKAVSVKSLKRFQSFAKVTPNMPRISGSAKLSSELKTASLFSSIKVSALLRSSFWSWMTAAWKITQADSIDKQSAINRQTIFRNPSSPYSMDTASTSGLKSIVFIGLVKSKT